jgi:hypothetical protein
MADLNNDIEEYRAIQTSFTKHYQGIMETFSEIVKELRKDAPERKDEWTLAEEEKRLFTSYIGPAELKLKTQQTQL